MTDRPRVSAIIVFLNEERFLREAIESVLAQSFADWELLLCDDGSTDGSTTIARKFAAGHPDKVFYVEHPGHQNRGMSATRNLGLSHARGEFISWLDGDDVWVRQKLERQVALLADHPEAAMTYGPLHLWYGWTGLPTDGRRDVVQPLGVSADELIQPPELLLRFIENEVHTPSGVMVRREILNEVGGYDESFRGMHEDGIVHVKICLDWPVFASAEPLYRYRQHPDSCCNRAIAAGKEQEALRNFLEWVAAYLARRPGGHREVRRLVKRRLRSARAGVAGGTRARALDTVQVALRRGREVGDRVVPRRVRSWVGLLGFGGRGSPPSGWLHWGNLKRVVPVSGIFGFDRGTPIDRFYIARFLERNRGDVRGSVLEIGDRSYTTRYGGDRVAKSDVLHARPGNPEATFVGDLCTGEGIPTDAYDCIILTQVLPFLWDVESALENVRRALKPGGVVLATVPGISQISRFDADAWGDFWRFTSASASRLFSTCFGPENVRMETSGNVLAATAFLHGVAAQELNAGELDFRDPDYELIIALRAVKPALE